MLVSWQASFLSCLVVVWAKEYSLFLCSNIQCSCFNLTDWFFPSPSSLFFFCVFTSHTWFHSFYCKMVVYCFFPSSSGNGGPSTAARYSFSQLAAIDLWTASSPPSPTLDFNAAKMCMDCFFSSNCCRDACGLVMGLRLKKRIGYRIAFIGFI